MTKAILAQSIDSQTGCMEPMMSKTVFNHKQTLMKLKPLLKVMVKSPRVGLETHRAYG